MPRISEKLCDSIVYLFPDREAAEASEGVGGTAFLIGTPESNPKPPPLAPGDRADPAVLRIFVPACDRHAYLVTADHVISQDRATTLRVNRRDGSFEIFDTEERGWFRDPDNDLAVYPFVSPLIGELRTHLISVLSIVGSNLFDGEFPRYGLGDDCFIVGRFIESQGQHRNTPTVRFGQIAQLPRDPVPNGERNVESFLVDMRHVRGGFSGSPVFVYDTLEPSKTLGRPVRCSLLGICWGRFPADEPVYDTRHRRVTDLVVLRETGMMAVTPAWRLRVLLGREDVAAERLNRERAG